MILDIPLLDVLAMKAGCAYLSDLHDLDVWRQVRLARILKEIPAHSANLKEWNDALEYLFRAPPQASAEAARERLLQALSRP